MLQVVNLCVVSPVFPQAGSVNFKRFKKTYVWSERWYHDECKGQGAKIYP